MLQCPACRRLVILNSYKDVKVHLSLHLTYGEIKMPFTCMQTPSCQSTFTNLWNFMRHLKLYHPFIIPPDENASIEDVEPAEDAYNGDVDMDVESSSSCSESDGICFRCDLDKSQCKCNPIFDLKESLYLDVFNFLVSVRSKSGVPYTTSLSILKTFERFFKKILDSFGNILNLKFKSIQDHKLIPGVISSIVTDLDSIKTIFTEFQSEFRIQKLYESHPMFVPHKAVAVGTRFISKSTNSAGLKIIQKTNTAQVVSIKETCKKLLSLEHFCDALFESEAVVNDPGIYSRFQR